MLKPGVYPLGKFAIMKALMTIGIVLTLVWLGAVVWSQEGPGGEAGDSTGVTVDGAVGSDSAATIEGPPILGRERGDESDTESEGADAGEAEPADSGRVAGARSDEGRAAEEGLTPPGGEEAPAGAEDDEEMPASPGIPYPDETGPAAGEEGSEAGGAAAGEGESGAGPRGAQERVAEEALPPGGRAAGPPVAVSEDRGSRYGYTLTLRSYRKPVHKRFKAPAFNEEPALPYDFDAVLDETWLDHSSTRTFETEETSLSDFSEIDIPIKFPDTIGRVIGQGANLSVSGSEQITFGGQTSYIVNEPLTERRQRSKFPQLDMKQHLKIDLSGTVGEKIHVTVHHDSEIQTPLENRIKLRYEGDDDEIVQNIEMGNTNLAIPGSQFVSYSGQHQGLFGAKMLARFGPLDVTAIASKQEGETASSRFEGAAKKDSVKLEDTDYLKNRFFFLMDPATLSPSADAKVESIWVYLDDGDGNNNEGEGVVDGYPFIDAVYRDSSEWDSIGYKYPGKFNLLERNRDYALNEVTGSIDLVRTLDANHTLAVSYVYNGERVGGIDGQGRLILKMIRLPYSEYQADPEYWGPTIKLERKNVYSLRASFVSEVGVEIDIYRHEAGTGGDDIQNVHPYRKILGIDLYDENFVRASEANNWQTDDYVDPGRVYGELGLLEFPDLRPFDPQPPPRVPQDRPEVLEDTNPDIYETHYREMEQDIKSYQKYFMVVRFSTPQTTFNLGRMNILQGSEVVTIDGRRLVRGVDYDIYYDIGQIRFKTEEAADPDAKITIDYEYVPLISFAQEFLGGLHGVYSFSDKSHIASAWIYQSKKSPEERPRLGQEPSNILMGDVNARFGWRPGFMTALMDALPIVGATQPSRLDIAAEVAASYPNPNTKGDVYVDDMEGVKETRSFSMTRESWLPASPPTDYDWRDTRAMWWYLKDREVLEEDIFPEVESRPGEAFIPVLEMDVKSLKYDEGTIDPARQWAGLQRLVSKAGSDFSRLKFLEVWLRKKSGDGGGRMHIDLGTVSENFYRPWVPDGLHTEDGDRDGELSDSENTGLDGVADGLPGDDPDDEYYYNENDPIATRYSRINGYEKDPGRVPDTEDLDGDGNLDVDNTHFRFSFDLSEASPYFAKRNDDWYNFRIPLEVADTLGGSPNWISTKYIRFFFTDIDTLDVFQLAYLQMVGTSWLEEGLRDAATMESVEPAPGETYGLSAKNTTDDPDYVPPFDPGKDPEGYRKREQSLVFNYVNLQPGNAGPAYKTTPGTPENYTLYQSLTYYVHGDAASAGQELYHYVRIGADSVNFYEYGVRVVPGWQTVEVSFDEITNLKLEDADSVTIYGIESVPMRRVEHADGWMAVYGDPSLTRISRATGGVINAGSSPVDGEVWFDDMRLTDVRKDPGYATRVSMGASFSDILTLTADVKQTDTEFQTRGSRRKGTDDTNISVSATTKVDRFLPNMGIALPLSARLTKSRSVPTLKSRSDITLKPEQRREESSTRQSESYSLGISKSAKSKNFLMRLTLDLLSVNVSMNRKRDRTPEVADTNVTYNGSATYAFRPWWRHTLPLLFGYSFSFMPDEVNLRVYGTVNDSKRVNLRKGVVTTDKYTRNIKGDFNIAVKPLYGRGLDTDYNIKMTRDLDTNKQVAIYQSIGYGQEIRRDQRYSMRITPAVGRWLRPTFVYDVDYNENSGPEVREGGDPPGVRRAASSSRTTADFIIVPGSMFTMPARGDSVGVSWLKKAISKLPDVTMGYVLDRRSKYFKLLGRPNLAYQFGWVVWVPDEMNYGLSSTAQRRDEITRREGYNVSTDFRPFQSLSLSLKYKTDKTIRHFAGGTTYKEVSTWPEIGGNTSTAFYSGLFGGALANSSLNFGYKVTSNAEGQGESRITREGRTEDFVPLIGWDATWKNGVRTTFNVRHSRGESSEFLAAASRKTTTMTSFNFSLKHSFSAPQGISLPLAGRTLRFKSNLSLSLDVTYESRLNRTPAVNNRVDLHTTKLSVIPKLSYGFSKSITGSANARFEQLSNKKLNETRRTIGLNVSVLIKF